MTLHHPVAPSLGAATARFALPLFAVTLFGSALLLFAVQPMFTRMVLPILGGAPSVWSVAMVFFQAALLVGYGYAHLLARTLPVGPAALVHLGVLAAAAFTLPIAMANFGTPPESGVGLWLIGLFAASIGLPFVALSASAPLLQSWFAASGHRQARQPLRPLRCLQSRLIRRAARLSAAARVAAAAARTGLGLVGRFCRPRRAGRGRGDYRGARHRTTWRRQRRRHPADGARSSRLGRRLPPSRPAWSSR